MGAETVGTPNVLIGAGHHRHGAHRPGARGDRTAIEHRPATALGLHDRAYPGLGHAEPARRLRDEITPAITCGIARADGFGLGGHDPWEGTGRTRPEKTERYANQTGPSSPLIEPVGASP